MDFTFQLWSVNELVVCFCLWVAWLSSVSELDLDFYALFNIFTNCINKQEQLSAEYGRWSCFGFTQESVAITDLHRRAFSANLGLGGGVFGRVGGGI